MSPDVEVLQIHHLHVAPNSTERRQYSTRTVLYLKILFTYCPYQHQLSLLTSSNEQIFQLTQHQLLYCFPHLRKALTILGLGMFRL
jgi:hypothetical protein